jgi:hypothetical protein
VNKKEGFFLKILVNAKSMYLYSFDDFIKIVNLFDPRCKCDCAYIITITTFLFLCMCKQIYMEKEKEIENACIYNNFPLTFSFQFLFNLLDH